MINLLLVGISLQVWATGEAWARPCYVQSLEDRYTLDQDEPEYTLRDHLWIINQAWRAETRDARGNRLVNPYYDFCRDGTNERGKAIRRLVLTESRYFIDRPLPPVVVGEGETLVLESLENGRAVLAGDRLQGRDSDCGLYLGLDAERLWREATDGQNANPNPQVLAEWRETLSGDNIILRNIDLSAFPQHALCLAANPIHVRGIRFYDNEGAAVLIHEQASGITWEENEMWQNGLGGITLAGRVGSREPVVEDVFEEADSWRIVGSVPDRVAVPYTLEVYLQNPDPDQTHPEGVFPIRAKEFFSRRFEIYIPKERGRLWPSSIQENLYRDLNFHLQPLESSRYYPFTLLVIDRSGKMSTFSDPFRPEDYLGCSFCRIAMVNWEAIAAAEAERENRAEPEEPVVPSPPPSPPPPPSLPAPVESDTDVVSDDENIRDEEPEEIYTSTSCRLHPVNSQSKDVWGWLVLFLSVAVVRRKIKDPRG